MTFQTAITFASVLAVGCGAAVPGSDAGTDAGLELDAARDVGEQDAGEDALLVDASDDPWGLTALRAEYGILETIAGAGVADDGNDWLPAFEGGAAIDAELSRPHTAHADGAGNLYISDKEAHAIRRVDVSGVITTVAGTGVAGLDGDGPATSSRLSSPNGIWVLSDGTFYVLDLGNDRVCRVADGEMTTLFDMGAAGLRSSGV